MKSLVKNNVGKITGEENVLKSPVFNEAFDTVLHLYQPKKKFAVCSLCSQTKPFSSSIKWRGIIKIFAGIADLIIVSSAGIIPLEYENYYPFNSYDSHSGHEGSVELSEFSKNLFYRRLNKFFQTFHWDKVVFLLDPYEGASCVVEELNKPNIQHFPSFAVWDSINESDFCGYSLRFCKVLNKRCLQEVEQFFGISLQYLQDYGITRTLSLFEVMQDIFEKLDSNTGYTKKQLIEIINSYNGGYNKSYIYKVIEGNCVGTKDYKFYIKNNQYFVKVGKLYYKNTPNLKVKKALF